MTVDPEVIKDYERWLHKVANEIGRPEDHDDLVNEGRIAMWKSLETFDPALGALASWITTAARSRMKDLAWGRGQPTGHEAVRGSRQVEEGPSLDGMEEQIVEALVGRVELAYHDGEILDVVRSLPREQQEYVFLRFWGGLDPASRSPEMKALVAQFPAVRDRSRWRDALPVLTERLAHLT